MGGWLPLCRAVVIAAHGAEKVRCGYYRCTRNHRAVRLLSLHTTTTQHSLVVFCWLLCRILTSKRPRLFWIVFVAVESLCDVVAYCFR